MRQGARSDRVLRLIIAYKLGKGAVQLVLAAALGVAIARHVAAEWLRAAVVVLRHHLASATSLRLAGALLALATPRHLGLTALALALDGALSTGEGLALRNRRWWGPWLVVVATGSLVPYELVEFLRMPRIGRALLLVGNVLIVVYLVSHALSPRPRARAHA